MLFSTEGKDITNCICFLTDIQIQPRVLFSLTQNTIYGIRHNFRLFTCLPNDNNTYSYDRYYETIPSTDPTTPLSYRYTVFYTTSKLSSLS